MIISRYLIIRILSSSFFFFLFSSCVSQYDKELKTPDSDGHGYNLTPLGCLLDAPWHYDEEIRGFNVNTFLNEAKFSAEQIKFTENEMELAFELQRDGTLKYWFSRDYIKPPLDTITLANGTQEITKTILSSKELKIKKIYISGNWKANFSDSTIKIDFGENNFQLKPINAKWYNLGSDRMTLEQTIFYEELYEGKKGKFKKVITCYLSH